ncbi:hypothetical protein DM02DRAFT_422325 [Periconia macrospinosa]|uniref:Uncharacterized protein n=1 Tax=Periconia macrospinosa TaxID=97972 RepID=A0A2V1CZ68_9PLEO|nr:hypothetical protein DM02DRAFT_422325 [Periconia macrospinosa]
MIMLISCYTHSRSHSSSAHLATSTSCMRSRDFIPVANLLALVSLASCSCCAVPLSSPCSGFVTIGRPSFLLMVATSST